MTEPSRNADSATASARQRERDGRIFALTLFAGFLVVALIAARKHNRAIEEGAGLLSAVALLAALLFPGRLERIRRAWTRFGEALGYVTTPIFMTVVYYLILTPIAIIRRATRRREAEEGSRWHKRPPLPGAARMERQF